MNGVHDLGGMHGHGPVLHEENEPVFHAPWEARVFGLFASTFVFAGYTVDEFRHTIENMFAPIGISYREMTVKSARYRRAGRGRSWQTCW